MKLQNHVAALHSLFATIFIASCANHQSVTKLTSLQDERVPASVVPTFGRSQVTFGREDCVTISPIPGSTIAKGAAEDEDSLCKINFEDPKVALCPASYSTNPATEVLKVPEDSDRETFEKTQCKKAQGKSGKKIAKYKQSTSCSHTSSILGYNKLGQALGVHLEIPTSVYRSMELKTHARVEEMARRYATSTIGQTWAGLIKQVASANPRVVKDGFVYGALLDGVGGETRHPTLNKRGSNNRAAPFMATSTWGLATNSSPIAELISPKISKLDVFIEVRDSSEMVLLDHIMAQQDRFGNIAARNYIYWIEKSADEGKSKVEKMRFSKATQPIDKNDPAKKSTLDTLKETNVPFVEVERMVLKDNDCGLRPGDNDARVNGMLSKLRHMGPSVYAALQKISANDSVVMMDYFQQQLLMSRDEASGVWERLKEAATILKKNCNESKLKLDLEVESFLGLSKLPIQSCD